MSGSQGSPGAILDPDAEARNEAIMLLGNFAAVANHLTEAPSRRHAEFIAEAARLWQRVRPQGGLPAVDRKRDRGIFGFALEAWARSYLDAERLNEGYARSEQVRDMHWRMTGRRIETSNGDAA